MQKYLAYSTNASFHHFSPLQGMQMRDARCAPGTAGGGASLEKVRKAGSWHLAFPQDATKRVIRKRICVVVAVAVSVIGNCIAFCLLAVAYARAINLQLPPLSGAPQLVGLAKHSTLTLPQQASRFDTRADDEL